MRLLYSTNMPGISREDLEGPKIDRRTTMKLLGSAGMGSLMAGCTGGDDESNGGESGQAQSGGTITAGWLTDVIEDLDPHQVELATEIEIHSNIFSGLTKLNENVEIVGDAAQDWSLPDESTYVFQLHDGITFHNGDPLDAQAVKASLERLQEFEESAHRSKVGQVEEIEADGHEVTIHLSEPVSPFISFMLRGPGRAGTIVHAETAEEDPEEYNRSPIGSGPFQVTDRVSGESLTLERFDDYWETDNEDNQLPYLDQIDLELIPEPSTIWSAIQGDAAQYVNSITGEFARQAENAGNLAVVATSSGEFSGLAPLCNKPHEHEEAAKFASGFDEITDEWEGRDLPTEDKRVRQALAMGIDREQLVENAWFGYAAPAHTLYNPAIKWLYEGLGGEEPDTGQYYDPDRAEELLDEAGYTGNPRLEFDVLALPENQRELTVIQEQWRDIGVEMELDIQQQSSYWDQTYRYEHMVIRYGGGADVDPWMSHFKQFGPPDPETSMGEWQRSLYLNEEYGELLLEDYRTPDREERIKILTDANEIFVDDPPYFATTFPLTPKVMSSSLKNVGAQAGLSNFHYAYLDE